MGTGEDWPLLSGGTYELEDLQADGGVDGDADADPDTDEDAVAVAVAVAGAEDALAAPGSGVVDRLGRSGCCCGCCRRRRRKY